MLPGAFEIRGLAQPIRGDPGGSAMPALGLSYRIFPAGSLASDSK
jgi:hypothetical protein